MAAMWSCAPPPLASGWARAASAATWFEQQLKASDLAWPAIEADRYQRIQALHEPATRHAGTGSRMAVVGEAGFEPANS